MSNTYLRKQLNSEHRPHVIFEVHVLSLSVTRVFPVRPCAFENLMMQKQLVSKCILIFQLMTWFLNNTQILVSKTTKNMT